MIAVVDYGMGNLRSVEKALQKVGEETLVTSGAGKILNSEGVVLPRGGPLGIV
jgi:glutamine amidotransferase